MAMDAAAIEYFHSVARHGSISRAAVELQMEQSTLTRHIGRLEDGIGVRLFHRSGRGMVLTDAGSALLLQAEKLVESLRQARQLAVELAADAPLQITVGAQPTIAQMCFGPLGHALRQRFPHARIRLVEGLGHRLVQLLQDGEIDTAVLYLPEQGQGMDYDLLLQEPLYCVLPPGMPLPGASIDVPRLLDLPLVLPSTAHGLRGLAESLAQRYAQPLRVALECDGSTALTRQLVHAGHGCTILPLAAVQEEVERGLLQAVPIEGTDVLRAVASATARNRPPVAGLREAGRLIRQVVTQVVDAQKWPGVQGMAG
ncbi:LysR family transcriptional regulator [Xylophilus rhododendri]|uniref:LysR family transcriptional regulator n=1 Tax=Xylophilus rhododendri TaxID=2697032 RepID=A0A857JC21_9BURK|nr:LysR family transcriptional regulator [Xylophilus rhododendri]QHJ00640.1 LysR family transcriptional regulator [Xylophilus rhododendri]